MNNRQNTINAPVLSQNTVAGITASNEISHK